jgi:hypothetical protein
VAFLATSAWADFDSGDIAVIEADPTILQPGEDFDLGGKTLTFTPKTGGGYTIGIAGGTINPNLGTNLALEDDVSTGALALGFTFPFFSISFTSVFVNSNGYATFGAASSFVSFNSGSDLSTVLDRMAEGFPRIAGLWNDLDPSAGGGVFLNALADRVLITWNNVPRFGAPGTSNTVQITLFPSGLIQLTYGTIGPASTDPVLGGFLVGISPGGSNQFGTTTLDFHTGTGGSVSALPNLEPLVQVFGSMPNPLVHIPAVARRFYQSHGDAFDQFVMFANFTNALGDALAFELPIRISMTGTGQSIFNATSFFGSAGRLHSMLNMNILSVYPNDLNCLADPTCRSFGNDSTLTLMGQEAGHQWLAYLQFNDSGVSSDLLLGRDLQHWSFFHDSDASNMEGNNWIDNGNSTFTSNELTIRYSALDQYAMGLRSGGEVPNFFFIRAPSPPNPCGTSAPEGGRACSPAIGVTVSGTRQNVSISQVIAIEGPRPFGFTGVNPTTVWHQAFILLVGAGTTPSTFEMSKIDTIRSAWIPYFANAVSGRGSISTNLASTPSLPDLVPSINPIPSTGTIGGTIQLSGSVVNQGAISAGAFRLGFYFSSDTTITTGDVLFATCNVSGLAPAASFVCSGPVTIPASLSPGVYFIGVIADDQNSIAEGNEANNTAFAGPITVTQGGSSRLTNISTRALVQTDANVMIGGFIIGGDTPKTVLVRAIGPSLANFNVPGALANPFLQLFSGQTPIAENDDWQVSLPLCQQSGHTCGDAAAIGATGSAPSHPLEAALLITLPPGPYTAIVSGVGGSTGVGLVEVFEVDTDSLARLTNISTRAQVQTGANVMIGGFIIGGDTPKTVMVRAIGPSLANFNVPGALANPFLQLFSGQTPIAENDDWQVSLPLCQQSGHTCGDAAAIAATGSAPSHPLEAAILITLNPGPYTAIVSGVGGTTGVGLVEVFEVP